MLLKHRNLSFARVQALFCFSTLAFLGSVSSLLAQAPPVVIDAQQTIGHGYSSPAAAAIAPMAQSMSPSSAITELSSSLPICPQRPPRPECRPRALRCKDQPPLPSMPQETFSSAMSRCKWTVDAPRIIECLATNGVLNGTCNLVYRGSQTLREANSLRSQSTG